MYNFYMFIFDTIVAEATAPYESALSIIRVSGPAAGAILSAVTKRKLDSVEPRKVYVNTLYNLDGREIDQATFVYYSVSNSYTGEESIEFFTHGSRIIVEELITVIVNLGARRAEGGEFTAKAYFNGKLNLIEAESVNELIKAKTHKGKELALQTLKGTNYKKIEEVRNSVLEIMARIEVDIDYPEYDDAAEITLRLKEELPRLVAYVNSLCHASRASLFYLNGVKVALIGEPNVGKSTLLNAVIGYDKAIVTPMPGTTRDVVEGERVIDGMLYKFLDTAGIRENPDPIERIGIARSYRSLEEADIICYVFEHFDQRVYEDLKLQEYHKPIIKVQNKTDIVLQDKRADVCLSALKKDIEPLIHQIKKSLNIKEKVEGIFSSQRDLDLLNSFKDTLIKADQDLQEGMTLDVVETLLLKATKTLDRLLGKEQTLEDLYTTVFKSFCVGK